MSQVAESNGNILMNSGRIRAIVLGSGNIGTDLALRMKADARFTVVGLVGRRRESPGLKKAESEEIPVFWEGFEQALSEEFDVFFDATSALDHISHWNKIKNLNKLMVDLTPSQVGQPMVPLLMDLHENFRIVKRNQESVNYSMITCGGQSSAALIYSLKKASKKIFDIEVSSSIAAKSAGLATRRNVDNYISATENLAKLIGDCSNAKAILVLNPAEPAVMMRTTVTVQADNLRIDDANQILSKMETNMRVFVPGFQVIVPVHQIEHRIFAATVLVEGAGFHLPKFAGNLDVINAAAVETAAKYFVSGLEL